MNKKNKQKHNPKGNPKGSLKRMSKVPKKENKTVKRPLVPKDDGVFKALFGSVGSERIVKSLLQSILEEQIEDVELDLKQEFLPENIEEGRENVLDVRVRFNNGTQAYIEMQRAFKSNIGVRSLFYWARAFSNQAKKGDKELVSLKKTYGIWILDEGEYFEENDDYHNVVKMKNKYGESNGDMFESIELHFFELQKLRESGTIPSSDIDCWMWFIDHTNEEMVNMAARSVKEINEAVEKLRELQSDPLIAELAFKRDLAEMDANEAKRYAKEQGLAEGRAEGRAKGRAEGRAEGEKKKQVEIAKNMKELDIEIEKIIKATGLSKEEIEKM